MSALGATLVMLTTAACGGTDTTAPSATGSRPGATSAAPSPSPACVLVSTNVVNSTFGVTARLKSAPSTGPFQDGKQYSCDFRAESTWWLSVTVRVFTAPLSVDDLVSIGVSREQFATKVSGVGDGAAYIKRSDLIQFAAVQKSGNNAKVAVLLGSSGTDDEAHFSTIAKAALQNAPG